VNPLDPNPTSVDAAPPIGVGIGDLDRDGRADFVFAEVTGATPWYGVRPAGAVSFAASASIRPLRGTAGLVLSPEALALVDLDGDGDLEIVTVNRGSRNLTVLSADASR